MKALKFTLKAWPVIAIATIGLCFVTQVVAKLFGIDLPDQQNVGVVRDIFLHAFDSAKHLADCVTTVLLVIAIMPVVEEVVFRWILWKLPKPEVPVVSAITSSLLFSAAHYLKQPFPDAAFIALFFFGLAQCWLYFKTDRLWCPMLNHALFNLTNMILIFVIPA